MNIEVNAIYFIFLTVAEHTSSSPFLIVTYHTIKKAPFSQKTGALYIRCKTYYKDAFVLWSHENLECSQTRFAQFSLHFISINFDWKGIPWDTTRGHLQNDWHCVMIDRGFWKIIIFDCPLSVKGQNPLFFFFRKGWLANMKWQAVEMCQLETQTWARDVAQWESTCQTCTDPRFNL